MGAMRTTLPNSRRRKPAKAGRFIDVLWPSLAFLSMLHKTKLDTTNLGVHGISWHFGSTLLEWHVVWPLCGLTGQLAIICHILCVRSFESEASLAKKKKKKKKKKKISLGLIPLL